MNEDHKMTPAQAEALGDVSAKITQLLFDAGHANPELLWPELVIAATLAIRALAVRECATNPAMTAARAHNIVVHSIALALNAPDGIIKIVKDGNTGGPDQAGTIPVRRH